MTGWYVVHTRPHQEWRAEENLARQGFRVWLLVMKRSHRHARRIETVRAVLFPVYLFVALDIKREAWRAINGTFGGRRLLADGPRTQALSEGFIAALQGATGANGLSTVAPADLRPGEAVTIAAGPFAECAAVVRRLAPEERVEVLLDVLGGRVPARLPRRAVVAAACQGPAARWRRTGTMSTGGGRVTRTAVAWRIAGEGEYRGGMSRVLSLTCARVQRGGRTESDEAVRRRRHQMKSVPASALSRSPINEP